MPDFLQALDFDGAVTAPSLEAASITQGGVGVVVATAVDDVVVISQSAYNALGGGRPATRLYLITS